MNLPEFAHPWILLLLVPLVIGTAWRFLRPAPALTVSSVDIYQPTSKSRRPFRFRVPLLLESLALAAFVVALARPQSAVEVRPVTREGIDIMLSLDFSNSMDAYDPEPGLSKAEKIRAIEAGELGDRLAVAAAQIKRFVERRPDDRIGLAIFGAESWIASPPTLDHDFLLGLVDQIDNSVLGRHERATNIAAGLATAIDALPTDDDSRRCIILITDGAHSVQDPDFTPDSAARLAASRGIAVHTIGIGSEKPFIYKNEYLRMAPDVNFRTETIESIAKTTGGRFFRAKDGPGFETVMDTIDHLETTTRVHPALILRSDLFPYPLVSGAILFGLALLLGRTVLHTIA
ncbi:VWA domain-containing protein [Haloferula sp.]|uniref:VWA domain-containing protein n=1 Tax=Haloferula sp. TaxID=2497595 RepID=UPI003C75EBC6